MAPALDLEFPLPLRGEILVDVDEAVSFVSVTPLCNLRILLAQTISKLRERAAERQGERNPEPCRPSPLKCTLLSFEKP